MTIFLPPLDTENPSYFPPVETALNDPDGLLAIGGDLSSQRLICAYEKGIFPWFSEIDPLLWWSPSERAVIDPREFRASRSLKRFVRQHQYRVSINQCFDQVIKYCAEIRGKNQTWITSEMQAAYTQLHQLKKAHSIEVWRGDTLVGGVYGVSVGSLFCGESMFSLETNGSKTALWFFSHHFKKHGGKLIDCQMMTPHLASLGAQPLGRCDFISVLNLLKTQELDQTLYQSQWITINNEN